MGKKKSSIPVRNKSPFGWWIASYLERFEYEDVNKSNPNRRCDAWENTVIIKAKDREAAFRKAERLGRLGDGAGAYVTTEGRKGAWRYQGLTSLLPIYEELEDGAEILWVEYDNVTVKRVRSMVKAKKDLETFDDEEDET